MLSSLQARAQDPWDAKLAERDRWRKQAVEHEKAQRFAEALAAYDKVLAIELEVFGKFTAEYSNTRTQMQRLYERLGDFDRARQAAQDVLLISATARGENHWYTEDSRRALKNLELRARLTPEQRAQLRTATDMNARMAAMNRAGRWKEAIAVAKRIVDIQGRLLGTEHPTYATNLNNLGHLHESAGNYQEAEPLLRRALRIRKKALGEVHPDIAQSLNNLAGLYTRTGRLASAESLLRQAVGVWRKSMGDKDPDYAVGLINLGLLYSTLGEDMQAEQLVRQALEIFREVRGPAHPHTAYGLNNLAAVLMKIGKHTAAEPLLRQALGIWKNTLGETHPVYATSLGNLASVYLAMGKYAKAEPLCRQALDITKDALGETHPSTIKSLDNLATVHANMGEHGKAEQLLLRALAAQQQSLGENSGGILTKLAWVYQAMGQAAKAEPAARKAIAARRRTLDNSAAVQSERAQFTMSRRFLNSLHVFCSVGAANLDNSAETYAHVLTWKGAIFARQYQLRIMAKDVEMSDLFGEFDRASRRLATASLARPRPGQAQARLSRIKALAERRDTLERELSTKSEAYRRARDTKRLTPSGLQAALPAGTVLVDFLAYARWSGKREEMSTRHLVAFVVRRTGKIRRVELGPAAPIAASVDAWRRGVRGRGFAKPGQELRELVWAPLEAHLAGATTVLISPDGALTRVPLAALPGKLPGTFLLEEVAVAVVPAPQLLPELLKRGARGDRSLLLLGDVDYGAAHGVTATAGRSARHSADARAAFARLANTGAEIAQIRGSFERRHKGRTLTVLRGAGATETAFREQAGRHRWLHLATHGFFASTKAWAPGQQGKARIHFGQSEVVGYHPGLLSGLALAGANRKPDPNRDDGILTALEVAALDLSGVEVAVLSACETGLGEVAGGEGVLGLQRAFQVAGARTTVTSLWKVPDRATRLLMERFYENVWGKKLGKLEALREAQLWMLNKSRAQAGAGRGLEEIDGGEQPQQSGRLPPYYWAAFVLSGDWR